MKRPARWIVLLGVDGTGKSTVLNELSASLTGLPYQGIKVFHRRPGVAYRKAEHPAVPVPHYGKPPYGRLLSIIKLIAMVIDWHLGYWTKIRKGFREGFLVIADRHSLLDLLADPGRYRYNGPQGLVRLAVRIAPMPDFVLLLDAPLEVLLARKRELPDRKMAELREAYLHLAQQIPNCYVVDASQPLDEVVASVKEKLQASSFSSNGKVPANLVGMVGKVDHEN